MEWWKGLKRINEEQRESSIFHKTMTTPHPHVHVPLHFYIFINFFQLNANIFTFPFFFFLINKTTTIIALALFYYSSSMLCYSCFNNYTTISIWKHLQQEKYFPILQLQHYFSFINLSKYSYNMIMVKIIEVVNEIIFLIVKEWVSNIFFVHKLS